MRIVSIFIVLKFFLLGGGSKQYKFPNIRKWVASVVTSSAMVLSPLSSYAIDEGIKLQLQIIRQQQIESQKVSSQAAEEALMSKELMYADGYLLARGMVILAPNGLTKEFDKSNFPYGLLQSSDISESLGKDDATLFILAVGREGPPVAALKYKLNSLTFPFVFEVTTDNLLFPYTPDAWTRSANSKDSVAITAILSPDGYLSTPSDSEWVGFAVSNPVQIAGTMGRTTAKLEINNKINPNLYTPQEIENLSGVDRALESLYNPQPASKPNSS